MATPSIALVPTGYKAGKLYSVLPEDGSGDFTVVRATTASRVNEAGLIESMGVNVPRLDYSAGGCPVLLTEPQSTNVVPYSEDFSNSGWTKINTTVTSGFASPDGTTNSFKFVESNLFERHFIFRTITGFTPSVKYTHSWYVKAGERYNVRIADAADGSYFGSYNLITGALIDEGTNSVGKTTITALSNGWYRLTLTSDQATNARYPFMGILPDDYIAGDGLYYQGDGTSGIYIWGAQLENQSYATSYIPTTGSSVTRNADQVTDSGDVNDFNSTEGVLFAEISSLTADSTNDYISISDGASSPKNLVGFSFYIGTNSILFDYYENNIETYHIETVLDITQMSKIAVSYNGTNIKGYINGFKVWETTVPAFSANTLNVLSLSLPSAASKFYGKTKQIQVFKSALTSLEIETLTSWASFSDMANALNYTIY